jgi:hypothetical protein
MKSKLTFSLAVILLCPLMMAPTAFTGGLGGFSGGTQGGQTPGDWGLPTPDGNSQNPPGEGNKQEPRDGEGNKQEPRDGEGNKQEPRDGEGNKQEPRDGEGNKQEPNDGEGNKQEPNDGEGNKQEPSDPGDGEPPVDPNKGEPNDPSGSSSSGGGSSSSGGGSSSSGGGSSSSGGGSGSGDPSPPLDPSDDQYDPTNETQDQQIPSGCAEEGSRCAQCVRRHEDAIQFNRRYLHIAWSTSHQTIEMANKALAFGDNVSGIHATQGLAWQLGGRPQIEQAVADLKKTYARRYAQYLGLIDDSLRAMSQCEQENFAIRDLYSRFGFLYMEFLRARYKSPD